MPLVVPRFLQQHFAQPVAVFGGGVSGQGVTELLTALGARGLLYDVKGLEFTATAARQHTLVVFSPGFAPNHPWLEIARRAGATCMGELDFASLFWTGRVIAITGTNGKTTLTEFLTHALRSVGCRATATGNVGYSFSRLAAETEGGGPEMTAVCEVSSFQAETLTHFRADASLWTNFAEDHLDRHGTLEAYFPGKGQLGKRTT